MSKMFSLSFLFIMTCTACAGNHVSTEVKANHHTETGFQNDPYVETSSSKGIMFVLRRIWGSAFHPDVPDSHRVPERDAVSNFSRLSKDDTVTWLGHSAFILRIDGKNILTDPFLSNRASPLSFVGGVTRYAPPGISIKNLPRIHAIIISHNHYDHLDRHTICVLPNRNEIVVFVPLGLKKLFIDCGYKIVNELDWWQSAELDSIDIVALPAVHDSARSLLDKDKTLWASWAIVSGEKNYYFGGDTGYSSVFKEIGKQYGSFDLAILPIGAYQPRHLMWMSHVTPEEAVKVALDINAVNIVGGHWGTIELSDEDHWEPPKRFLSAAEIAGFEFEKIWIMKIGEVRHLP